eukprot:TRINITY_DN18752_c0_g1_i1.p1 TRINITY_DN18752_c0_g1~~TRINITY_DN18752_c0_g1_i1.p1  ORF type:complete len:335 (+),score=0.73 TRINITY_DN18752_c0_g1_i1:472-1476(+)
MNAHENFFRNRKTTTSCSIDRCLFRSALLQNGNIQPNIMQIQQDYKFLVSKQNAILCKILYISTCSDRSQGWKLLEKSTVVPHFGSPDCFGVRFIFGATKMAAVEEWLRSNNLSEYAQLFLDQGYDDLIVIPTLKETDLEAIGVKPGHRRKILLLAQQLPSVESGVKKLTLSVSTSGSSEGTRLPEIKSPRGGTPSHPMVASGSKSPRATTPVANLSPSSGATAAPRAKSPARAIDPATKIVAAEHVMPAATPGKKLTAAPGPAGRKTKDGFCKYAPNYSCSVTSCYFNCLHCKKGYCTACLWGEGGKMKGLTTCSSCGKPPKSLPMNQRPGWG